MRLLIAVCLALALGGTPARADNPFGVMLWPSGGEDLALLSARAQGLGAGWLRPPAVFIDRWTMGATCQSCLAPNRAGLSIALTVRNGGHDYAPRQPSQPPADPAAYQASLDAILAAWQPGVLVVENEENNPLFYRAGQTADENAAAYGRQLALACETAHRRHVACANGGLSSGAAAALTWLALLDRNQPDIACSFARKAFYRQDFDTAALCAYRTAAAVPADLKTQLLENGEAFFAVAKTSAIDRLNIHWFGHDAGAFATVAETLGRMAGKPVMSNEIGLPSGEADPIYVRPLLRAAFASGVNPAIWFSLDTPNSRSLLNDDGSLRPTGREFLHQMSGRK